MLQTKSRISRVITVRPTTPGDAVLSGSSVDRVTVGFTAILGLGSQQFATHGLRHQLGVTSIDRRKKVLPEVNNGMPNRSLEFFLLLRRFYRFRLFHQIKEALFKITNQGQELFRQIRVGK